MKVSYCVHVVPALASYRLRVAIPAPQLGCLWSIGIDGDVVVFNKHQAGDDDLAVDALQRNKAVVYDVVNDHFGGPLARHYRLMCDLAGKITVGSETMAARVKACTGYDAVVIDDPWETPEVEPKCYGNGLTWFGHSANIRSLAAVIDDVEATGGSLTVCSNAVVSGAVPWSLDNERRCLEGAAVALVTGDNPGASSNRIVKALRAGRFVVTNGGVPAWEQFAPFVWIGNVADGIRWAWANREEACRKVAMGQEYCRDRFSPQTIGRKWRELFDSTLAQGTNANQVGCESISL